MKKILYVWQKEYNIDFKSWGKYTYITTSWRYFLNILDKYDLKNYLKKYDRVDKLLWYSECSSVHDYRSCTKFIFKVPGKNKKQFEQDLINFKIDAEIDKGFYIK